MHEFILHCVFFLYLSSFSPVFVCLFCFRNEKVEVLWYLLCRHVPRRSFYLFIYLFFGQINFYYLNMFSFIHQAVSSVTSVAFCHAVVWLWPCWKFPRSSYLEKRRDSRWESLLVPPLFNYISFQQLYRLDSFLNHARLHFLFFIR